MKIISHLVIFPKALAAEKLLRAVVSLTIGILQKQNMCHAIFCRIGKWLQVAKAWNRGLKELGLQFWSLRLN